MWLSPAIVKSAKRKGFGRLFLGQHFFFARAYDGLMQSERSATLMGMCGLALVVGFFMPWLDLGGVASISGWDLVKSSHVAWTTRFMLALCPLGGAALALAGFGRSRSASGLSLGMGLGVLGYLFFKLAWGFIKTTGFGLWIVIAAAVVAVIAAADRKPRA